MADVKETYEIFEPQVNNWQEAISELVIQINEQHMRMAEAFNEAFIFGGIGVESNSTATAITTAGVKVQVLIFDTNMPSNGMTPDHTQGHIEVLSPGTYFIMCSITVESPGGGGFTLECEMYRNNGAEHLDLIHVDRDLAGGGGESGSINLSGLVALEKGDTVELWAENETGTENPTFENVTLCMIKVSENA